MEYHPITKTITDLLKKNNCWFQTFEHVPVRTSEEASRLRPGYILRQGAKALIVRLKNSLGENWFIMLVFPANLKFNAKKIKALIGVNDLRLATEAEVESITNGVKLGGVPPFGKLFNLEVFVDKSLFENHRIIFNAGDRSFSVAMKSEDYRRLVGPKICDITLL